MTHDFDFNAWRQARLVRIAEFTEILQSAFTDGQTVREQMPHRAVEWFLGSGKFIAPIDSDPAYLANHVASRHFGFDWPVAIGSVEYRNGVAQ